MSMNELQKQTNANIQAKANLIWEIATHLVGLLATRIWQSYFAYDGFETL